MDKPESRTIEVRVKDLVPYDRNPRRNDGAVEVVKNSLRKFGYVSRIVVAEDMTIVAGHTRLKAMMELGWQEKVIEVTQYLADADTVRAFRIADNSTGQVAEWDYELLEEEIEELDGFEFEDFGFILSDDGEVDFADLESRMGEKDAAQLEFEEKFKPKHTTDDCFTPPAVYDAVKGWVFGHYGILEDTEIVRPFYPGGDYQSFEYPDGCLVLDNPPFSIQSEIVKWYKEKGIRFFLFSQSLTAFQQLSNCNVVLCGMNLVYENGASIPTAFQTSLGEDRVLVSSELHDILVEVQPSDAQEVGAYAWPDNVISGAMLSRFPKYGITMSFKHVRTCKKVGQSKQDIFGGGALVSDPDAERIKAERIKAERIKIPIELTDEEKGVIEELNKEGAVDG